MGSQKQNDGKKRKLTIIFILFILAIATFVFSISKGALSFTTKEVLGALRSTEENHARLVIVGLRLPRTIVAALVGMSLSISGCILQGIMRNHLA